MIYLFLIPIVVCFVCDVTLYYYDNYKKNLQKSTEIQNNMIVIEHFQEMTLIISVYTNYDWCKFSALILIIYTKFCPLFLMLSKFGTNSMFSP